MSGSLSVTGTISGPVSASTLAASSSASLSSTLSVNGVLTANNYIQVNYAGAGALSVNTSNNLGGLIFYNGASATGRYGSNSTYPFFIQSGGGSTMLYCDTSGNFTAAGNVTAYSDAKLKKDVETIKEPMSLVRRMRGVFYNRIEDDKAGVGVIAQEMQEVLPQVVQTNDGTLSVAYGNISGVLIEALKNIDARLATVEAR